MYTKCFNKKYNYIGHFFQAKYFSEFIEDDSQLLETSRYIHLNPVKARMVEWSDKYKWSSYSALIGEQNEGIINCNIILKYFKYFKYKRRYELYKEFVEKKLKELREILLMQEQEKERGEN